MNKETLKRGKNKEILIFENVKNITSKKFNAIPYIEDKMNKRWTKKIDFLVNKTRRYGKWKNIKLEKL